MPELLPTPIGCSTTCTPNTTGGPPGPTGPAGADGADGTDGVNAYSLAVGGEAMPAADGSSSVSIVTSTSALWMAVGQIVYVQFWGYMQVTAVTDSTHVTLLNLEDGTNYVSNSAPGTLLPADATISPGGLQGPEGSTDLSGYLLAANNLNDVDNVATSRTNLGLGTAAVADTGVTNGDLPPIDTTFTNGDVVFATASGLQTKTAADARTALGIPDIVSNLPMVLVQQQELTTVDGGDFTTGSWQKVPLNALSVDTDSIASIGSNRFTLPAGTYRYNFGVVGSGVGTIQGRLYNVTAGAMVPNSYGAVVRTAVDSTRSSAAADFAPGQGRFTIAVTSTFELQGQCESSVTGFGFGRATSFGGTEVYSFVQLFKEN